MLGQKLPNPKLVAWAIVDKRRLVSQRLEHARATGDRIEAQDLQSQLKRLDRDIESYGLSFAQPAG
jgi:hypothetical protein